VIATVDESADLTSAEFIMISRHI